MNGAQELGTAIANKIDTTIIVLNDNCYGMIKWKCVLGCRATGRSCFCLGTGSHMLPRHCSARDTATSGGISLLCKLHKDNSPPH